jgi:structural maintenance of chromosomes protein 6
MYIALFNFYQLLISSDLLILCYLADVYSLLLHSALLQHFMCHRFLTVNLSRNINFIHGANGSGKSAILAALQITLGAKARYTHRANKLADFIDHEWEGNAEVSVKLLNTESDGYRYDLYGPSITVKRILSHSGPSTLALISDDGVVVSKDRKEVSHTWCYVIIAYVHQLLSTAVP